MASRRRRTNQESARNGTVASEFERSNSTTAAFLGGKQKDWMLGTSSMPTVSVVASCKPSGIGNLARTPLKSRSTSRNENIGATCGVDSSANYNHSTIIPTLTESDRDQFPAQRVKACDDRGLSRATHSKSTENTSLSPTSVPEQSKQNSLESLTNRNIETDSALPSPTPSEDRNHERGHSIVIAESKRSSTNEGARATRLEQLMAEYGSVDEIEKHLQLADKSNAIQIQPMADEPLPTPSQRVAILDNETERTSSARSQASLPFTTHGTTSAIPSHKRGHEAPSNSRKRAQHQPRDFADPLFWSSLGEAYVRRVGGEDLEYKRLMQNCSTAVAKRINVVSALSNRGQIERPRLDLLLEACNRLDHSYLLLHQLYCWMHDRANTQSRRTAGVADIHDKGLEALKCPLAPNDELTVDAVSWFSQFPGPLTMAIPNSIVSSKPAQQWYARILQTLTEVTCNWDTLRAACSSRRVPPLVSEMLVTLRVDSIVLQQVMFRVMLRDIFVGSIDPCFERHEQVFTRNQRQVMGDDGSISRPRTSGNCDAEFADEHRKLWTSHLSHMPRRPDPSPRCSTAPSSTVAPSISRHLYSLGRSPSRSQGAEGPTDLSPGLQAVQQGPISNASTPLSTVYPEANTVPVPGNSSPRAGNCYQPEHQHGQVGRVPQPAPLTQSPITLQCPQSCELPANLTRRTPCHQRMNESTPTNIGVAHPQTVHQAGNSLQTDTGNFMANMIVPSNPPMRRDSGPGVRTASILPISLSRATSAGTPPLLHQPYHGSPPVSFNPFHIQSQQAQNTGQRPQASHSVRPSPQNVTSDQFIRMPSPRSQSACSAQANPPTTALHHALTLSPRMRTSVPEQTVERCFRFIKTVHRPTEAVSQKILYQQNSIDLKKAEIELLATDAYNFAGTPLTRHGPPGSLTYRIRCLKLKLGTAIPFEEEWVVSDHTWPPCLTVVLNGVVLELRRKSHYGKDLPIDVTRIVKEGRNVLTVAILDLPEDCNEQYAIGLEAVQVICYTDLKKNIPITDRDQARQRILSKGALADPDIEVLQPEITIDLTDPFTAKIFNVPTRGRSCQHDQCFDLETFLSTRASKGKKKDEPCGPDEFKCPICKGDVRPGSLVIDGFFLSVRARLQAQGRLEDTKAILIDPDGQWIIKEEEEVCGETGDGDGRCRTSPTQTTGFEKRGTMHLGLGRKGAAKTVIDLG
ncbi:MAG: hypothetical protein Q9217_001859 [Psora testacea]